MPEAAPLREYCVPDAALLVLGIAELLPCGAVPLAGAEAGALATTEDVVLLVAEVLAAFEAVEVVQPANAAAKAIAAREEATLVA